MSRSDITALSEGTDRKITVSPRLREFLLRTGSAGTEAALDDFGGKSKPTIKSKVS